MDASVKVFFYPDGTKESKQLFSTGTVKGFAEQGMDVLVINVGDKISLEIEGKYESVRVLQKKLAHKPGSYKSIEYHVAPLNVSPHQLNK